MAVFHGLTQIRGYAVDGCASLQNHCCTEGRSPVVNAALCAVAVQLVYSTRMCCLSLCSRVWAFSLDVRSVDTGRTRAHFCVLPQSTCMRQAILQGLCLPAACAGC